MVKNKIILIFIGVYLFVLSVLPLIIPSMIGLICSSISERSSYEIEVTEPKFYFSIMPVGTFKAKEINIKSKNNSLNSTITNIDFKFRILPLISGRLHVNNLVMQKVKISANFERKFELDKDFPIKFKQRKFRFNSVEIKDFEALIFNKDILEPISYIGKNFCFKKKNRFLSLKNDSVLIINGKTSKISSDIYLPKNNDINRTVLNVLVENINIEPFRHYFKHYLPSELSELKGFVNASATKEGLRIELINIACIMNDFAKSIIFPNKLYIDSKFNINSSCIDFKNINVDSDNLHFILKGKIINFLENSNPIIDFKVLLNDSKVEDAINLLPAFKVEEIDTYKLKKYKFYGKALANLDLRGKLPEPDIYGDIYIDNGILIKPILNAPKGATLKFNFTGKQMKIDVIVPAGGEEKVFVQGNQELYNTKFANLNIQSTSNVDLSTTQSVLLPLHEILNFMLGPLPKMNLSGNGNIDINIKGNRKNPHIWGRFNSKNTNIYFDDIPNLKIENISSVLNFNNQNIQISTKNGTLNKKEVIINGTSDLFGKFNIDVQSLNQPTEKLYGAILSSKFIEDKMKNNIPSIDYISGVSDLNLTLSGTINDNSELRINENIFAKGEFLVKNNFLESNGFKIEAVEGKIKFDNLNLDINITAFLDKLPIYIKTRLNENFLDLDLNIPKFNPNLLITSSMQEKKYLPYVSLIAEYKGLIDEINYSKLKIKSTILESIPNSILKYQAGGVINIVNNTLELKDIRGFIDSEQNKFNINLNIKDVFDKKPKGNGLIDLNIPELSLINEILLNNIFSTNVRSFFKDYKFKSGKLNLVAKIINNKVYSQADLSGISFEYLPLQMPIEIINGNFAINDNNIKLYKINLLADKMPILIDGEIKDLFNKINFNLYFNSKPQQEFIDKYINKYQIYPIKIKGDIVYWIKLKGFSDDYNLKVKVDMSKNSSFYHYGATLGDVENAIIVSLDTQILNNNLYKIKEFLYDKVIDSQNGKKTRLNLLKAWGGIKIIEDNLLFDNLHIRTSNPTDARIFNIIFRKPNIKEGQFTSNLKIDGGISDIKVLGDFHIFETNIPFLDTVMKNIELIFKEKTIEFDSKGDVMGNDITFKGILKNKLSAPYKIEKAFLYTKQLNLNQIIDKLKLSGVENESKFESLEGFDLSSIIAKNFRLKANNIILRNIHAENFEANISLAEDGDIDVKDFQFNIANGYLNGKYSYNLKSHNMGINLDVHNIDANDLTLALFDLKNQINGDLTGNANLTCQGDDFGQCMETLNGNLIFNVKDGNMPKLGSLEYLLKAGNLIKGGLTGLSINGIIDLISPSKTGEFEDIFGSVRIKDGTAKNIEITTKGDDLNLFIGGTYNFSTSIADMQVLGLLSKKISTILGPVGNLSINTLFNIIPGVDLSKDSLILERINKIPGIELSSKAFRKFIAEIKGNINGDNYVTNFSWIN